VKRYLLETHIWLWATLEPHRLTSEIRQALGDSEAVRFLSPVSLWELAVLLKKKRFSLKGDFTTWIERSVVDLGLAEVALTWQVVHGLRFVLPNHKDPADRFLAATAIAYDLTLVTADQKLMNIPRLKVLPNR
jgi:PIN domain nuclease of toxin-antitoxin system